MKQNSLYARKCFNCETMETPLWRKTTDGLVMCNACGLYYRNHCGAFRPVNKARQKKHYNISYNNVSKLEVCVLEALVVLKKINLFMVNKNADNNNDLYFSKINTFTKNNNWAKCTDQDKVLPEQ